MELILALGAILTLALVWATVKFVGRGAGMAALLLGIVVTALLYVQLGLDR
ncbi:hypothetical protein GCM10011385_31890 [Nitratireductor aestuarii]|uniref:Uncharacterized protein n=1 Tax=Nitratireductor aestuarii TaxID=1735103 RepID=A0A916RX95_9HYPH|nr:hypothetical protein [Nitratireductor aestuarii]GGA75468.1 hypothetical protein GCM10011385_31890 [Nitratireductor aestuarii]